MSCEMLGTLVELSVSQSLLLEDDSRLFRGP
jgi:hypothetical protein